MEKLIYDIVCYAALRGWKASTVLQRAIGASGTEWERWTKKGGSCSLVTADRVRAYMVDNPPLETDRSVAKPADPASAGSEPPSPIQDVA